MSDGVIYKSNGTAWTKPTVKDTGNTTSKTYDAGLIKHSNGTTWYDNYPMTQLYSSYFNVTWTQGYNGSGDKLDSATFGDHPRSGDVADFYGVWGFDRTAMKNFVANGVIQQIKLLVYFDDPTHTGNPIVKFYPHNRTSKPSSYSNDYDDVTYQEVVTFVQTGSNFSQWIEFPVGAWMNGTMGGITCHAPEPTATNSCRFAGKTTSNGLSAYTSKMWIQVLK